MELFSLLQNFAEIGALIDDLGLEPVESDC